MKMLMVKRPTQAAPINDDKGQQANGAPIIDLQKPSCSIPFNVPSPFKKCLFRPEPIKGSKPKRCKEQNTLCGLFRTMAGLPY